VASSKARAGAAAAAAAGRPLPGMPAAPRSALGAPAAAAAGGPTKQQQQQQQQQGQQQQQQQEQGQQQQAGPSRRGAPAKKLYVLDGRVYNYKKDGAAEVSDMAEAGRALEAAQVAAEAIYGLGAGGNKGLQRAEAEGAREGQGEGEGEGEEGEGEGGGWDGGGRGGRGRGRGGGGRGRGPPNFARKEQNKAAVGNHHRKDRAMRKMGL
jgi:hypothetical protein